jgi:DNA-binding transcriptional LysR family regulator
VLLLGAREIKSEAADRTMARINFDSLDLNLLKVLDALLIERSTTRAALRLNASQPTISHALARLRHLFNDELFIRSANGMAPTEYAVHLGTVIHPLLTQLRTGLAAPQFEPETSNRVFTIACGDYTTAVLLPALLGGLGDAAPNIHLRLVPLHPSNVADVEDGLIDLVVADFGQVADMFETEPLLEDTIVGVMRQGNPHARPPLTIKQLAELPLVIPSYGIREEHGSQDERLTTWRGLEIRGGWHIGLLSALEQAAFEKVLAPKRVTLVSSLAAIEIARTTDFVAVMPSRFLTGKVEMFGLEVMELAGPGPDQGHVAILQMLWHKVHGVQPAVLWLRDLFKETATQLAGARQATSTRRFKADE